MPLPLSFTEIKILLPSFRVLTETVGSNFSCPSGRRALFAYRIESIIDQIQNHSSNLLRNDIDVPDCWIIIGIQRSVEGFVAGTQAMIR